MVKRSGRVYWRQQGGVKRAYGDFRDFSDVGGRLEALKAPGVKLATTDRDIANQLATRRVKDLESRRRNRVLLGVERQTTLGTYAEYHLKQKSESGKFSEHWLTGVERHLAEAYAFFGNRDLSTISTADVQRYLAHLRKLPARRTIERKSSVTDPEGIAAVEWSGFAKDLAKVRADILLGSTRIARVLGDKPVDEQRRGRRRAPTAVLAVSDESLEVEVRDDAGNPCVGVTVNWWLPMRQGIEDGTVRAYLNSLSNLYRRAASEGYVMPGFNPVAALIDKPVARTKEAKWLEVSDAARLLEAARTYTPPKGKPAYPHAHPLLAAFLLTGGRKSEVLGLMLDDLSFDRKTVTFRPNEFRGLKSRSSHRVVTMWPQLEEILRTYVFGGNGPRGALLFASLHADDEAMLDNFDKTLGAISKRAGFDDGFIHLHMLRHTYCSARLQTLDRGHPVSPFVVGKELGHGGDALVRRIYGHLGEVRHRSEVVEYQVSHHVTSSEVVH